MDTGPLVAYFYTRDAYHEWATETLDPFDFPLITCEPVLTETCFLVARNGQPPARVLEPVGRGRLRIGLQLDQETAAIRALMERYADVPMSLADACLVRLAELTGLPICTLDDDFSIYRAHRRPALDLITPGPGNLHKT